MRKQKFTFFILSLLLALILIQCYPKDEKHPIIKTRIALLNPSVGYLESFISLIENEIINIDNLGLTLVIYLKARNDLEKISNLLQNNKYPYITIKTVNCDLQEDILFHKNECSAIFYQIFKESDAILFFGGPDFPPSIYKEKTKLLTEIVDPYRHYFEISFIFHLLGGSQNTSNQAFLEEDPDFTIVGFCLGMQTMNVGTGGTMYQDIPTEIYQVQYMEDILVLDPDQQHRNYWWHLSADELVMRNSFHRIKFNKQHHFFDKLIANSLSTPTVYSSHHQAIKNIGQGFQIIATSMDGKIAEVIVHKKYKNVFGVQFHPEFSKLYFNCGDEYKLTPKDTVLVSPNQVLKEKNSLSFHKRFWYYFAELMNILHTKGH